MKKLSLVPPRMVAEPVRSEPLPAVVLRDAPNDELAAAVPVPSGATRAQSPAVALSPATPTVQPLAASSASQLAAGASVRSCDAS